MRKLTETQITIAIDQFWGPRRRKVDEALARGIATQEQADVFFAAIAAARLVVRAMDISDEASAIKALQSEYNVALTRIAAERGVDMAPRKN